MPITDLLGELSLVTHSQLMARDMFQKRIEERREIAMHELIYPVLQGFDSVALESDLTIVGSDQLFNESMGRELQAKHGQRPQTVITSTITAGLDGGAKQSKSLGNYVGLAQAPEDKFGRLMTLNDELIGVWARIYTLLPPTAVSDLERRAGLGGVDARNAKLDLAEAIVARHHGSADATQARRAFVDVFSERGLPTQMPRLEVAPHATVVQLVNAARPELTRSAARRLIAEGAVRINGVKRVDSEEPAHVNAGDVLQAGRRRWFTLAVGSDLN